MSTTTASVREKFTEALDHLIAQVKEDRSILAAILCGSLSHDTVWANSDIDLALITIDDKKVETASLSLFSGGVNIHASLTPRNEFRKIVESSLHNSFMHSLLAKGRLLYTHDETITGLYARLHQIGERDTQLQLLAAATCAAPLIDKAHKWFITRCDLNYTALWILHAAQSLARIEVIGARQLADREVIPQAMKLNPPLFQTIYADLLNAKKTRKNVQAALDAVDGFMAQRASTLFRPVFDHLREVAEARSCSEIEDHFKRNFGLCGVAMACEYLANGGLIGRAATPVHLTKRSNIQVQEQAFVYLGEAPDAA
jgi:uncharacterized protein